jgi:hypothetical protein
METFVTDEIACPAEIVMDPTQKIFFVTSGAKILKVTLQGIGS